jgi:regulator of sigma E protease
MKNKVKYLPTVILFLAVAVIVRFIVNNPAKTLNILIPLVWLGVVILVHEFGHFIVARMCKMKTEAFSLGFGHVVLGFKKTLKGYQIRILPDFFPKDNDPDKNGLLSFTFGKSKTDSGCEYRISLIPLGGYVKILGQEDMGSAEKNPDPNAFMNKPVWQRLAVIAAGVTCNIILAIIIFMVVFSKGLESPPPIVGDVIEDYPAKAAGLVAGDEIIEIDGETNIDFQDIMMAAALSDANESVNMKVKHQDGSIGEISMIAKDSSPMKTFGIVGADSMIIGKVDDPNDLYKRTGLKEGDKIVALNNLPMQNSWQFYETLSDINISSINLTIDRITAGKTETFQQPVSYYYIFHNSKVEELNSIDQLITFYSMVPRLKIPDPKNEAGKHKGPVRKLVEYLTGVKLQVGDIIVSVAGTDNPNYKDLRDKTNKYENMNMPLTVLRKTESGDYQKMTVYTRPEFNKKAKRVLLGTPISFDFDSTIIAKTITNKDANALGIPAGATIKTIADEPVENFNDIFTIVHKNIGKEIEITYQDANEQAGTVSFFADKDKFTAIPRVDIPLKPLTRIYKTNSAMEALNMGIEKTGKFIMQTYVTIKALFVGNVSASNLMGPIAMIGAGSRLIEDQNFMRYLWLQGLISACLAVMNFLPIPVVDGGHAVILIIEKIKGSPVNHKIIEAVSYVGFVLLMGLFVFVTWNDLVRVILDKF